MCTYVILLAHLIISLVRVFLFSSSLVLVHGQMLITQLDPLTEQQMMGIYSLQQSSQQAEEALTQGLEQLQQSLVDTVAGGLVIDGMQQMVIALGKLANLEGFVRQVLLINIHDISYSPHCTSRQSFSPLYSIRDK